LLWKLNIVSGNYFKILEFLFIFYITGATVLQKSRTHLKILGARKVMQSTFYTEEPQTFAPK